ncbi:MAG: DUF2065 family protein [Rhizobiaceae bacterium]|nr:DUF2065 family protein [Rhizobiaceae bacterium]
MVELFSIIGVFLAIEGALYAGAPSMAKKLAHDISQMEESTLRRAGLIALGVGVGLVWMVRG